MDDQSVNLLHKESVCSKMSQNIDWLVFCASFIVTNLGDRSSQHEECIWFRLMEVVMVTLCTWWLFRIREQDVTGRDLMSPRFRKYSIPIVHLLLMQTTVSRLFLSFAQSIQRNYKYFLGRQNFHIRFVLLLESVFQRPYDLNTSLVHREKMSKSQNKDQGLTPFTAIKRLEAQWFQFNLELPAYLASAMLPLFKLSHEWDQP